MEKDVWIKPSRSNPSGNCVEVCDTGERIKVRDTKDAGNGPTLSFTVAEWNAFIGSVRDGEFDL